MYTFFLLEIPFKELDLENYRRTLTDIKNYSPFNAWYPIKGFALL